MSRRSSGSDRKLLDAMVKPDRPFVWLNRLRARHLAQSLNSPRTDETDARMLARFGAERRPAPHLPRELVLADPIELVDLRDQLKRMETQGKNDVPEQSTR